MRLILASMLITGALALPATAPAAPVTQTITYQGELNENGVPKNGTIDVIVKIFDAAQDGAQFETKSFADVPVTRGLFTLPITLDNLIFFEGGDWWLQIAVRDGALSGAEPHAVLSPRQLITSVPYAINADAVGGLSANALKNHAVEQAVSAHGKSAFKRSSFNGKYFGAVQAPVEFAILTVLAPATGTLVVRARGYCQCPPSTIVDMGTLMIGTSQANAVAGAASDEALLSFLPSNDEPQVTSFTTERTYPINAGQSMFLALYGERISGTADGLCTGTLSAELFPASL